MLTSGDWEKNCRLSLPGRERSRRWEERTPRADWQTAIQKEPGLSGASWGRRWFTREKTFLSGYKKT